MKLLFTLCIAALFAGCSSSPNYINNEILGEFPSIYMERAKALDEMKLDMRAEGESIKSPEDYEKVRDKYVAKEEKLKVQTIAAATKEIDRLRGTSVPFQFDYDEPNFEVRSATIADAYTETGALTIEVVFGAKRTMKASPNTYLYYLVMDKSGQYISKFQINPFVAMQVFTNRTFPHGNVIEEGDTCSPEGSQLMLYCASYDYTDFSHILFINKASYDSLR